MLHDLARLYSEERLVHECARRGIEIDAYAREHPLVLHAPLSASLAEERFAVTDADVLSAVRKHTLAAADMSALDCIVYLADSLEPARGFAERTELAALAARDLRSAMRETIASSVRYLEDRHLPIAPQTTQAMRAFAQRNAAMEAPTARNS
jgi:predicted HD superfamily hydrolase involved in NAD metabolism